MIKSFSKFGLVALLLFFGFLSLLLFGSSTSSADEENKLRICHRSDSATHPYNSIVVDYDAVDGEGHNDHTIHTGPIFNPAIHDQQNRGWGDIIPVVDGVTTGLNWPEGQSIWENDCRVPDEATDDEESTFPSMSSSVSCGEINLTFKNPTRFFFSFDYRVDDEDGTDDGYANQAIANGPWAGQLFGLRYNSVDVLAGQTEIKAVTFSEDSGVHKVAYRLWRGAENDWYLDWEEAEVLSDCEENQENEPVTPVKSSTIGYNIACFDQEFAVDMDLTKDDQAAEGVLVNFSYHGINRQATTNVNGRARVSFPAQGNYLVQANPDDGFPSQSIEVKMPENCPAGTTETKVEGQVLGASTSTGTGQVLGVNTLADTGNQAELALVGQIALLMSGQLSAAWLLRKKLSV